MNNKKAYTRFCKQHPGLPVFAQPWYLDSTCLEGTWNVVLEQSDTEVIAAWPYFLKKKGPFKYITMPPPH